ncbi:MAG: hypothetical protein K2I93_06085, partial [Oscillospiraceae bacterium]|nr:hypothetical protein [Oscillospiraceae bacterium]
MGVLTSPDATAASPMISPPTMLTAPPTAFGSRSPASLMISYISTTPISSKGSDSGSSASALVSRSRSVLLSSSGWWTL